MKTKDIVELKQGDFIEHKHYGLCIVDEVTKTVFGKLFGLTIRPLSIGGFILLANQSGVLFNRFLETSYRLIIRKVNEPKIPKLIFQTENGFDVHIWEKLGEVTNDGKFSSIKVKEFAEIEDAKKFAEI